MATSGYGGDDGDNKKEGSKKWPLEYLNETKEFMCGWCSQALTANPSHVDIEKHFQRCEKLKETALLMGFKDLLKVNQKIEGLNAFIETKVDKMKAELMKEIKTELLNIIKTEVGKEREVNNTEFNKGNMDLISNIRKDLENEMDLLKKNSEASDALLLNKIKILEKGMTEKVRERGVTLSEQIKTNDGDIPLLKEMETAQKLVNKKKIFHQESSLFPQLTIPHVLKMNCFNLLTQGHLFFFSSSYVWDINGFETIFAQKTFKMTSEVFWWKGYPVEARAKLQLKEDDRIYVSLCLEDVLKDEEKLKEFSPIPLVFYLLKGFNFGNTKRKCFKMGYSFDTAFNYSLGFETCLGHKSRFLSPKCNAWDPSGEIEIFVEPPQMTQHIHSYDGTLEWKLENYERRFQLGNSYFAFYQKNPYFYTSPRGYRVQVEIFLKGKEGLTAIISFLTGKFDAELPKSFPHSTIVTLINRKDPERNIKKTMVEDIKNLQEYPFEICKVEEAANLIENDTLFCKVVIKAH